MCQTKGGYNLRIDYVNKKEDQVVSRQCIGKKFIRVRKCTEEREWSIRFQRG